MTNPADERHPLDDDPDDGLQSARPGEGRDVAKAYQPLLQISKFVLIASGAVVLLSGIAAGNAPPNSSLETLASVVNRLSMVVLLCGFVALLVAYRIPHFQGLSSRAPVGSLGERLRGRRWTAELEILLLCNLGLAGVVWCMVAVLPPPWLRIFLSLGVAMSVAFAGLLVTMALWHEGALRAYAIGTVTAILLELNAGMGLFGGMAIGRVGSPTGQGVFFAILVSLALLSGLVCAAYVTVLSKAREASEAPVAQASGRGASSEPREARD